MSITKLLNYNILTTFLVRISLDSSEEMTAVCNNKAELSNGVDEKA